MPYYSKKRSYSKAYPKARHVDKKLLLRSGALTAATQSNTVLFTPTVASTLSGLRINGSVIDTDGASSAPNISWAVVVVKEGYAPNNINTGSSGDFYIPEQDVWAWGVGQASTTTGASSSVDWVYQLDISPKTKRKLEEGDNLYLCVVSSTTASMITNTQVFVSQ